MWKDKIETVWQIYMNQVCSLAFFYIFYICIHYTLVKKLNSIGYVLLILKAFVPVLEAWVEMELEKMTQ